MDAETKISVKNSIAARMLVVVLGLYIVIALCVTFSHVWMEYNNQKSYILKGLEDVESAFNKELAVSLWGLDQESLTASVKGMLKIPTLVGVKIITEEGGVMVAIGGMVTEQGETGNAGLHVNLSGLTDTEKAVHKDETYHNEMFERQFTIVYEIDGKNILLGKAVVYSCSSVIFKRMKLQVAMLGINVALTLLTFSLALWWAINRYLRRPLADLASSAEKVTLENLDSYRVKIDTSGRKELKILEESFNAMIGNLNQSMAQREQADENLRQSLLRIKNMSDAAGAYLWEIDTNMVYTYVYGQSAKVKGFSPEALLGHTPLEFMPAEDIQPVGEIVNRAIAEKSSFRLQHRDITPAGEVWWEEVYGTVFCDENGTVIGLRGTGMSINDRKQAEEERQRLQTQLIHAQKMEAVGRLAGGVAHDFNNMLGVILGHVDLTLMKISPDQRIYRNLEEIKGAAMRSADLTRQLLAFARKQTAAPKACAMGSILSY